MIRLFNFSIFSFFNSSYALVPIMHVLNFSFIKLRKIFHLRLYLKCKKIHPHVLSSISLYMNNFSTFFSCHLKTILLSCALLSYHIWNKSHFSWKCPISSLLKMCWGVPVIIIFQVFVVDIWWYSKLFRGYLSDTRHSIHGKLVIMGFWDFNG